MTDKLMQAVERAKSEHFGTVWIDEIEARSKAVGDGEWHPGHLVADDCTCDCPYIFDEAHCGAIGEVYVDNGKDISDGGNDCPTLELAKANLLFIAHAKTDIPRLTTALRASLAREAAMREALELFAKCAPERFTPLIPNELPLSETPAARRLHVGDLRRAASVLEQTP